jgi:predicted metallopeptidase
MQAALGVQPYYVIEVISERFDGMSEADQTKTLIHELLHIPKAFGGGFKGHGYVSRDRVERLYRSLQATSGLAA